MTIRKLSPFPLDEGLLYGNMRQRLQECLRAKKDDDRRTRTFLRKTSLTLRRGFVTKNAY